MSLWNQTCAALLWLNIISERKREIDGETEKQKDRNTRRQIDRNWDKITGVVQNVFGRFADSRSADRLTTSQISNERINKLFFCLHQLAPSLVNFSLRTEQFQAVFLFKKYLKIDYNNWKVLIFFTKFEVIYKVKAVFKQQTWKSVKNPINFHL